MARVAKMKTNGKSGKMKLTKSKLKQLIKEAFDEEEFLATVPEGEEEGEDLGGETIDTVDEFMKTAQTFYDSLPEEKKRAMAQAFELHFDKWEEELEGGTEEEDKEEDEGEYEKLRGVYGRKTQRGTPLSPTQAVWATKRGYPFQSEK